MPSWYRHGGYQPFFELLSWQTHAHTCVWYITGGVPSRLERSAQQSQLNATNEAVGGPSCLPYIQGPRGLPGRDGRDGLPGPAGPTGMRGEKGEAEMQGLQGRYLNVGLRELCYG